MSKPSGLLPRAAAHRVGPHRKRVEQGGCKSRGANSAPEHRPCRERRESAPAAKPAEKLNAGIRKPAPSMSSESRDKVNHLNNCIVVRPKEPNSVLKAGRQRLGRLRPKRTRLIVGPGGVATPVAVTPETGEQVGPTDSKDAQHERRNPLPVPDDKLSKTGHQGMPSHPRRAGQNHKSAPRSGEGCAPKRTPVVIHGMGPQSAGDDDGEQVDQEPQGQPAGNSIGQITNWGDIPWKTISAHVYKLAHLIHLAAKDKRYKRVRHLQQLLVRSYHARLYVVRKVCQFNDGKKSAGVDGVRYLSDRAKLELAQDLELEKPHAPFLRKWVPKPGKPEDRPLALPTIYDRCRASLVKLALEPEVEANLHRDVYGYRLGRSQRDAMASLRNFTNKVPTGKFALDADIENFFGSVSLSFLMASLKLPRPLKRFIRSMLHAPTMDKGRLIHTPGIPQGSPLSPVLANLVLSGIHEHVERHFQRLGKDNPANIRWKPPGIIVYSDDLVAVHTDQEALQQARTAIEDFLRPRGLRLHPDKTTVRHTLVDHGGRPGFNFLGFTVRSFRVGKHKKAPGTSGLQTLIRPSAKSRKRHHATLASILKSSRHKPLGAVIKALNRVIDGWVRYHGTENSADTFSKEDHILFEMLWHFLKRRHRHGLNANQLYKKYWPRVDDRKRFRDPESKLTLLYHADQRITAHIKVRKDESYYNGNRAYWRNRLKRLHPLTRIRQERRNRAENREPPPRDLEADDAAGTEELWLLETPRSCGSQHHQGAGCDESRKSGSEGEGCPVTDGSTLTLLPHERLFPTI